MICDELSGSQLAANLRDLGGAHVMRSHHLCVWQLVADHLAFIVHLIIQNV